jgi:hypothetical protein
MPAPTEHEPRRRFRREVVGWGCVNRLDGAFPPRPLAGEWRRANFWLAEDAVRIRGADPRLSHGTVHAPGGCSAATPPFVWGAAPATACGWGATPPCWMAQAGVNSAPKNTIRAESKTHTNSTTIEPAAP